MTLILALSVLRSAAGGVLNGTAETVSARHRLLGTDSQVAVQAVVAVQAGAPIPAIVPLPAVTVRAPVANGDHRNRSNNAGAAGIGAPVHLGMIRSMYLRMNPSYLAHGCLLVAFHLMQLGDRVGEVKEAVGPVRPTDPAQPEHWSVPGLHLESSAPSISGGTGGITGRGTATTAGAASSGFGTVSVP